ncbi:hypothetical protein OF83DRAFT_655711 [Amylostereum chailletii]|nr:hypothetical protein OF83DRAFT_655711 [Amylostereum chailletii]
MMHQGHGFDPRAMLVLSRMPDVVRSTTWERTRACPTLATHNISTAQPSTTRVPQTRSFNSFKHHVHSSRPLSDPCPCRRSASTPGSNNVMRTGHGRVWCATGDVHA